MIYTKEAIKESLGVRLVGKSKAKHFIVEAIQKLPQNLLDKILNEVWFISSFDDAWGFVLKGEELKGKSLVFLSDELFEEPKDQIEYTILHEIGHVVLNHRNGILEAQSQKETERQEKEADQFAKEYL